MKRKRTREEVAKQVYLNQTDIADLLQISKAKAKRLYEECDRLESDSQFRVEDRKVMTETVCRVAGISLKRLQAQIKG